MGRRPVDPALALARTIGISVRVAEHETWLQMPMTERRRISLLLRHLLREELGFGATDVREQLLPAQAHPGKARPRAGAHEPVTARKDPSRVSRPHATHSLPEASQAPAATPFEPASPAPVAPRAASSETSAAVPQLAQDPAPLPPEPDLDLDGWV